MKKNDNIKLIIILNSILFKILKLLLKKYYLYTTIDYR